MSDEALDREIDRNYDYFRRHVAEYIEVHRGRIALLKNGRIVDFFEDPGAADREGKRRFDDGLYSLQPVVDEPIGLGFFSHAGG